MNHSLTDLAGDLPAELAAEAFGNTDISISAVVHDSREVKPGALFVCLKGDRTNGHDYIDRAITAGAAGLVVSEGPQASVPTIRVTDTRRALPYLASAYYGKPSSNLGLTGVTGTNGKTTVVHMIASIFRAAGRKTGVIGTVGVEVDGQALETHWSVSTTPESTDLQALFAAMRSSGVQEVVMEVSSHAIDQDRIACCAFDTAVFTNLTQDHLDYHITMDAYRAAKERLFTEYGPKFGKSGFSAALNYDNETGRQYGSSCAALNVPIWSYGSPGAMFEARDIAVSPAGTSFTVTESGGGSYPINLNIGGLFNVPNALAAIATTRSRGIAPEHAVDGLRDLPAVPGRFELVSAPGRDFHVIVDYAHTPDGLENLLKSARALNPARLVCVFGCGGDRDRTKRPIMGRLSSDLADITVVTSDNPRTEQPDAIIADIVGGIPPAAVAKDVYIEPNRRAAIRKAVGGIARSGDLVVIAGKGHETYQIVGHETFPFDDRLVAREELALCDTASEAVL